MAKQIIYKKRFLNKLDKLLIYLEKEWSITIANEFLDKLEEKMHAIKLTRISVASHSLKIPGAF
jgi:hypothetical protein